MCCATRPPVAVESLACNRMVGDTPPYMVLCGAPLPQTQGWLSTVGVLATSLFVSGGALCPLFFSVPVTPTFDAYCCPGPEMVELCNAHARCGPSLSMLFQLHLRVGHAAALPLASPGLWCFFVRAFALGNRRGAARACRIKMLGPSLLGPPRLLLGDQRLLAPNVTVSCHRLPDFVCEWI